MLITIPYLLLIEAGWVFILLSLAECIAIGFITRAIMKSKNREGGFGWGFFLAGIGIIVCATKRRIVYETPSTRVVSYLSNVPEKKEPEKPKPITWKCTNCEKENETASKFCISCGERRHYKWKCASCEKENAPEVKFCPECGNARSDEQELLPVPITADGNFIEYIKTLGSAAEIATAFEFKYGGSEDENVREMIALLEKSTRMERSYGNMKAQAIKHMESFFGSDMKFFSVDRTNPTIDCPICGKVQRSDRESCFGCGALFKR